MGKPGPLDDGFAKGVRFVFGAIFGMFIVLGSAMRTFIHSYAYAPQFEAAFIAVGACVVFICGLAAAKYKDDFWENLFDVMFWWRR